MPKTQIFLGFDFGLRHIGVAAGQTCTQTAQALTSLSAHQGTPNWDEIAKLINTWQAQALVVGLPYKMDGTEQPITKAARHFIEQLKKRYSLPVYEMDERLSTAEAREYLFAAGGYKALKKKSIDSLSAQLILESWLRTHPHTA